jgi:hypothetical protein
MRIYQGLQVSSEGMRIGLLASWPGGGANSRIGCVPLMGVYDICVSLGGRMRCKPLRAGRRAGEPAFLRFLPVIPVLLLAGCAHSSEDIVARSVPEATFNDYECEKIASEAQRISSRMNELKGWVNEQADDDRLMTTVGILAFPPLLFFLKGDTVQAEEYANLKGEYATLQAVSAQKQCPAINPV